MLIKTKASVQISFLIAVFLISFSNVFAQDTKTVVLTLDENSYTNLRTAIQSENPGLRESGIYFAGKYSVSEVSETLLEQLRVEADPKLKILIMRVLYIIEENKYMDEIYTVALNDENTKVRNMASAIYSVMQVENSVDLADKGN